MKNFFSKKSLLFLLVTIFILSFGPVVVFGVDSPFYRTNTTETKSNVVTKIGSTTIINRSDKDFFVPNNTASEITSFAKNAPKYVSVTVCGDTVCGDGEKTTCPQDCQSAGSYCGDGVCKSVAGAYVMVPYNPPRIVSQYANLCSASINGWMYVPVVNFFVFFSGNSINVECNSVAQNVKVYYGWEPRGEAWQAADSTQTTCKDDCAPPTSSGCGVCGYDSLGNSCPNYCNDRGYNMINCTLQPAYTVYPNNCNLYNALVLHNTNNSLVKKYLTTSSALAYAAASACIEDGSSYTVDARYTCNFGSTTNMCPAGQYCGYTGGLKPGTSYTSYANATWLSGLGITAADLQKTCPAGHFCPIGATYPRVCPLNTYSTGGAEKCTACPSGTEAQAGSISLEFCSPAKKTGDGACNEGENPTNSPYDCPDSSQVSTGSSNEYSVKWRGDGRCSGQETNINSPIDCSCGDGKCNNGETYLSCLTDCACMDSVCGTAVWANGTTTIFKENKWCKSYTTTIENRSNCKYMNEGEICGNGVCENGEKYNSSLGKIVCSLDCHCGDGSCSSSYGEFYSATSAAGNCNLDCHCGDGTCNYGESSSSCSSDCHCGNSKCETSLGENRTNCSSDCRCGDNICSVGETQASCSNDCFQCNYDKFCDTSFETKATCADCKGTLPMEL